MCQMLGWIGNVFFIAGALALAAGNPFCSAALNLCGNVLYFAQSWLLKNWALLFLSFILGALSVAALFTWWN